MLASGVCNNAVRTGGFGPMYQGFLTSCFNDVVLIPLPNFLLVLFGLPIVLAARSTRDEGRLWRQRWFDWVLDVLVLAALCMNILEIVRLALSNSGIGLLPTALAGILTAMFMSHLRRTHRRSPKLVSAVLVAYWAVLVAFEAIKVDELHKVEQQAKAVGDKGPNKYPNSDKSLDNYVILALYAVFFLYELVNLVLRGTGRGTVRKEDESDIAANKKLMSRV